MDKGKTLIRKLGKKVKSEDKKDVKLEKMIEPSKEDYEPQQLSADTKGKSLVFIKTWGIKSCNCKSHIKCQQCSDFQKRKLRKFL